MPAWRRIVVPAPVKKQVLLENHKALFAGHFSTKKLMQCVSQYYYWPQMKLTSLRYVNDVQLVYNTAAGETSLTPAKEYSCWRTF